MSLYSLQVDPVFLTAKGHPPYPIDTPPNVNQLPSSPDSNFVLNSNNIESPPTYAVATNPDSSSVTASLQTWNPYSVLPSTPSGSRPTSGSISNNEARSDTMGNTSSLPDPFHELSIDAQRLVNSISDMGFPRPRVARAVHKLGENDKQVGQLYFKIYA